MTRARSDDGGTENGCRGDGGDGAQRAPRRSTPVKRTTAIKPLLAAVALSLASTAAGSGGSSGPPVSGLDIPRRDTARLQGRRTGSWRKPWRTHDACAATASRTSLTPWPARTGASRFKSMAAQGATWTATNPQVQSGQPVMPVVAARGEPTRGLR